MGQWILTVGPQSAAWRTEDWAQLADFTETLRGAHQAAISPDRERISVASCQPYIELYDSVTGPAAAEASGRPIAIRRSAALLSVRTACRLPQVAREVCGSGHALRLKPLRTRCVGIQERLTKQGERISESYSSLGNWNAVANRLSRKGADPLSRAVTMNVLLRRSAASQAERWKAERDEYERRQYISYGIRWLDATLKREAPPDYLDHIGFLDNLELGFATLHPFSFTQVYEGFSDLSFALDSRAQTEGACWRARETARHVERGRSPSH